MNNFFIQEHCKFTTSEKIPTFFSPPFLQSLYEVLFLIFEFFHFHTNSICILVSKLIVDVGISVNKARWITFEIANDLKTTILPSDQGVTTGGAGAAPVNNFVVTMRSGIFW